VVEDLGRTLERGEIEKPLTFFSSRLIARFGIGPLKEDLGKTTAELRQHGGIKSIKVVSEDEADDLAEVLVEITRGNGDATKARYKFVKEQGVWKIDDVSLEMASQSVEPLHLENAVQDVVKVSGMQGTPSLQQTKDVFGAAKQPHRTDYPSNRLQHEQVLTQAGRTFGSESKRSLLVSNLPEFATGR
jgi:hypothetical protein